MIQKLIKYLKETRTELSKVNWPNRQDTIRFTATVILVSLFVAIALGGFDYLFRALLFVFINQ
ncbi:MAG: preprotein translocase subunit SecE [Patescibacteria group bacterium]